MSLVSDALRKARQEAAEREGGQQGSRFPAAMVHPGRGSRLGVGLLLGALITLLAAAGGGLAAWWLLGARSGGRATAAPAVAASAPAMASGEEAGGAAQEPMIAAPSTPPLAGEETSTPPAPASPPPVSDADGALHPSAAVPGEAAAASEGPGASSADSAGHAEGDRTGQGVPWAGHREFVAEADLGSVKLVLDYIAYRPSDPFAQINGVELHEGYHIEGFTVKKIARDRVELEDDRGTLVLRVR